MARIMICLFCAVLILPWAYAQEETNSFDDITAELAKEMFLEKSYNTGLSFSGSSGFFLTPSAESIYEGGLFAGAFLNGGSVKESGVTAHETSLSLVGAWGVKNKLFGPFTNLELSASLPVIYRDTPDDSVIAVGDLSVTGKVNVFEEDPFKPTIPGVSLIATVILPTGGPEVEYVDTFGIEGGVILGKAFSDPTETMKFKAYLEILGSFISYDDTGDFVLKGNLGLGFPVAGRDDLYMTIEYGMVSKSEAHMEDGDIIVIGLRYRKPSFNASGGIRLRDYDDLDKKSNSVFLAYDMKF